MRQGVFPPSSIPLSLSGRQRRVPSRPVQFPTFVKNVLRRGGGNARQTDGGSWLFTQVGGWPKIRPLSTQIRQSAGRVLLGK